MTIMPILLTFLTMAVPEESIKQNLDFWGRQLKSESTDLKINALYKLWDIRSPESLSYLTEALKNSDPEVRNLVIRTLSRVKDPSTIEVLHQQQKIETNPYLKSEIKRSIKAVEELLASSEKAKEKTKKAP